MRPRVSGFWSLVSGGAILLVSGCASTASSPNARFDAAVTAAEARCRCRVGVSARHVETNRTYEHNAAVEFESASVIKIAVLTEAMAGVREGRIDLAERWTLEENGKADGSGILLLLDAGLAPTWSDLLTLMIGPSDNTATNAWIGRLGIDAVNARMASLGFADIRLLGTLPEHARREEVPSPWTNLRFGAMTPGALARWYERVAAGELLDADSSRRVFEYLDKDPSRLRAARRFPSEDLWAGKTGTMKGVRNDSGILRTKKGRFVLVLLTDGSDRVAPNAADHPSVLAIADVAKTIVDEWSRELADLPGKPR